MPSILEDAVDIVRSAKEAGVEVRLAGSAGVASYTGTLCLDRPGEIKDIDLVAERKMRVQVQDFLEDRGWVLDRRFLMVSENREVFTSARYLYTIDVYYDEIDGNHPINIGGRLLYSFPAIPYTDLLLSKLQRRHPRPVDIWDCCALLSSSPDRIEDDYLCKLLGREWGLYTTVTDNLERLSKDCSSPGRETASHFVVRVGSTKKTISWRLRSIFGRRFKWWKEVYEASL